MTLIGVYTMLLHVLIGLGIVVFAVADERPEMAVLSLPLVVVAYALRRRSHGMGLPPWMLNVMVVSITLWALSTATWAVDQTVSEIARYIMMIQLLRLYEAPTSRKWAQEIGLSSMLALGAALTNVALHVGVLLFAYAVVLMVTVLAHQVCVGAWKHGGTRARGLETRGAVRIAPALVRDFVRVCAVSSAVVLVCSVVVFIAMPRGLGRDMFFGVDFQPQNTETVSRFTDTVTLGEQGRINESSALVMRVTFEGDVGRGPHLMRGVTLNEYDGRTHRWSRDIDSMSEVTAAPARYRDDLWQDLRPGERVSRVELIGDNTRYLFSLARAVRASYESRDAYRYTASDGVIRMVGGAKIGASGRYMVRSERPSVVVPEAWPLDETLREPFESGTSVPAIAVRVLEDAGVEIDGTDPLFRTRAVTAFEAYLGDGFGYSLDQVSPTLGTDPLTFFLEERKEGHCEYFASSLAALCRCVGINARMVTGYVVYEQTDEKSGDAAYTVRESNAHAWTEVEMAPGVWNEFDPSPADGVASQHEPARGLVGTYQRFMDSVQIAWSKYVVNFDSERQKEAMGEASGGVLEGYSGLGDRVARLMDMPAARFGRMMTRSVSVALLAFALTYGGLLLARLLWTRISRGLFSRREVSRGVAVAPELARVYASMLSALDRAGLGKPSWVPPVAHASALAEVDASVAVPARSIAEVYYRAAFAGRAVSPDELDAAQDSLEALRSRLKERKNER